MESFGAGLIGDLNILEHFGAFWGILGAEEAATERLKSLTPTPPLFCHFQKPRLTPVKEWERENVTYLLFRQSRSGESLPPPAPNLGGDKCAINIQPSCPITKASDREPPWLYRVLESFEDNAARE